MACEGSLGRYLVEPVRVAFVVLEDLAGFAAEVELPDIEEGKAC